MKAVILAPGPSLARCPPFRADVTIGINRAAAFYGCDVFASLDAPFIRAHGHTIIGRPALFTRRETFDSLARRGDSWGGPTRPVVYAEDLACPVPKWDLYTATAALVLTKRMGAAAVDVYGADWAGTSDWDGMQAGENRGDDRWAREREIWGGVVEWLAERGCECTRYS